MVGWVGVGGSGWGGGGRSRLWGEGGSVTVRSFKTSPVCLQGARVFEARGPLYGTHGVVLNVPTGTFSPHTP